MYIRGLVLPVLDFPYRNNTTSTLFLLFLHNQRMHDHQQTPNPLRQLHCWPLVIGAFLTYNILMLITCESFYLSSGTNNYRTILATKSILGPGMISIAYSPIARKKYIGWIIHATKQTWIKKHHVRWKNSSKHLDILHYKTQPHGFRLMQDILRFRLFLLSSWTCIFWYAWEEEREKENKEENNHVSKVKIQDFGPTSICDLIFRILHNKRYPAGQTRV